MASIFSKIIAGEIPCFKLYEDAHCLAFLDIYPIHAGHTLIVPKIEIDYFADVPEPYYSAVFQAAKLLAKPIQAATNCTRIGTTILGWDVPHFHYHLIPMWDHSDINFKKATQLSPPAMKEMQDKILALL